MRYGSVCSGIEAVTLAWKGLGWVPAWFSEIEPFPCAVLAHHWPDVPNLGDMTILANQVLAGEVEAPDILVGGTPCQAFSVAGLRNSLADERGQLTLSYVDLANAIDTKRSERGEDAAIIVWENVPGVLNSKDNAFGCFLAGLAGESEALQPPGGKWTHAGCVSGPQRIVVWRVLDAQFFGVAQRRRRVFVIASARKGFNPAEILFELDSLRRDTPPSRETGEKAADAIGTGFTAGSHWDSELNPHPTLNQSHNTGGIGASDQEIFSQRGAGIVSSYRMVAFGEYKDDGTASTVKARDFKDATDLAVMTVHGTQDPDICHELAHPVARNHGQENVCIAFSYKDHGADAAEDIAPTIRAGNHHKSHANSGQPPAIAIAGNTIGRSPNNGGNGTGHAVEISYTLTKTDQHAVSFCMQVRRLMPVECERLQGMPDNHTLIPWKGKKAEECPDGPRYRAIGNSMAVPVITWLGERILKGVQTMEPEVIKIPLHNNHLQALDGLKSIKTHYLREIGDEWCTPEVLFWGINAMFGPLVLDLFSDANNAKCQDFYTLEDNALSQDWSSRLSELKGAAFANPPYSRAQKHNGEYLTGMSHIIRHAQNMREKGGRYVFLIKAATSETWWPESADHIAFIRGRIGFDVPRWFRPANSSQVPTGATFPGAIVVFDKTWSGPAMRYVSREQLMQTGEVAMRQMRWFGGVAK